MCEVAHQMTRNPTTSTAAEMQEQPSYPTEAPGNKGTSNEGEINTWDSKDFLMLAATQRIHVWYIYLHVP